MIPVSKKILAVLTVQERKKCFTLAICQLFASLLDIAALVLLVAVIDIYTHKTTTLKWAAWIPGNDHEGSLLPAGLLLLFFSFKNYLAYRLSDLQYHFVYEVAAGLSRKNMLVYLNGRFSEMNAIDSAVWIKKISQRPVEFAHYLLAGLQQAFSETCLLLLAVLAMLFYNALLFLWLLVLFLPALLFLARYTKRKISHAREGVKSSGDISLQYLKETLEGYVESNLYGKNIFFTERYQQQQQKLNRQLANLQSVQLAPPRLMELLAITGLFLLLLLQMHTSDKKWIDLTSLTAFTGFAYKCIPGIVKLFNISAQVKTYAFTLAELPQETTQNNIVNPEAPTGPIHEIQVKDLHFSFGDKRIFTGIDLKFRAGEITGISAMSGRGKTTLINLLLGFLEPDAGSILFNSQPVSQSERQQYWPFIAYIKQQHFVLHDTLLVNIILNDEPYDKLKFQEAITLSGLSGFIKEHPEGFLYQIQEQGRNISGGQRQRMALARALYKDAPLLIADEPFTELDRESTVQLIKTCKQLADKGKMILLITHDSYALSQCNRVISLDE